MDWEGIEGRRERVVGSGWIVGRGRVLVWKDCWWQRSRVTVVREGRKAHVADAGFLGQRGQGGEEEEERKRKGERESGKKKGKEREDRHR